MFCKVMGLVPEARVKQMKTGTKKAALRRNGVIPSRTALLAAHERALERVEKMTIREGFKSLVRAGIYKRNGKLAPRYGG